MQAACAAPFAGQSTDRSSGWFIATVRAAARRTGRRSPPGASGPQPASDCTALNIDRDGSLRPDRSAVSASTAGRSYPMTHPASRPSFPRAASPMIRASGRPHTSSWPRKLRGTSSKMSCRASTPGHPGSTRRCSRIVRRAIHRARRAAAACAVRSPTPSRLRRSAASTAIAAAVAGRVRRPSARCCSRRSANPRRGIAATYTHRNRSATAILLPPVRSGCTPTSGRHQRDPDGFARRRPACGRRLTFRRPRRAGTRSRRSAAVRGYPLCGPRAPGPQCRRSSEANSIASRFGGAAAPLSACRPPRPSPGTSEGSVHDHLADARAAVQQLGGDAEPRRDPLRPVDDRLGDRVAASSGVATGICS